MKLLDNFSRDLFKETIREELKIHETTWAWTKTMSDHEAKSRSIKELKAKKHHEKLSLLLWKISYTEKRLNPNTWSFLDPMPEEISMGFQMLTWLWSITIVIRPNAWHALSRNKDWRMMYWPWTQWNWIRKRNPIRFSGKRSFKKVFASMSIPENPWFLQAEDDLKMAKLAFANGFYSHDSLLSTTSNAAPFSKTAIIVFYPHGSIPPDQA